uniref:Tetraspanin n=1 Tax=Denticeps clupeoides TaxID=299321 RepID=A0AAY4CZ11_9TELE
MGLNGCGQISKCIVILFNIILAIDGLVMLGLGLWLRFSAETRGYFDIDMNTKQFVVGIAVLIAIGALMLIIAAFGDYGACNESRTALGIFAGLLAFLIILEIGSGVWVFTQSKEVADNLAEFYATVYAQYINKRDPSLKFTLTVINNGLSCCGIGGGLEPFVRDTCPKMSFLETFTYPSCVNVITDLFESKAPVILGFFLGNAAIMIATLICSLSLSKAIDHRNSTPPPTSFSLLPPSPSTNPLISPMPSVPMQHYI